MVAIVIILSGFAGLAAAVLAWFMELGFIGVALTYAIVGNLVFAVLSQLAVSPRAQEQKPDFAAEIEADLMALLEERYEKLYREAGSQRVSRYPVLRRPQQARSIPPRDRRLFGPN